MSPRTAALILDYGREVTRGAFTPGAYRRAKRAWVALPARERGKARRRMRPVVKAAKEAARQAREAGRG